MSYIRLVKVLSALTLGALIISIAACGKEQPIPARDKIQTLYYTQTFNNGFEVDREYIIHQPPSLNTDQKYPVVFGFHGGGEVNDYWIDALRPLVDSGKFVGVYLQGYLNSWNLGKEASKLDDIEFVNAVIQVIGGLNYLDMDRLYAIGYSNGASMVNQLALETSHFKAISPCAGQLIDNQMPSPSTSPVSVYQICGKLDTVIPYFGGFSSISNHTYTSSTVSLNQWATALSCDETAQVEIFNSDSMFVYSDCTYDREIRLHSIEAHGHDLNRSGDTLFYNRIWSFFERF